MFFWWSRESFFLGTLLVPVYPEVCLSFWSINCEIFGQTNHGKFTAEKVLWRTGFLICWISFWCLIIFFYATVKVRVQLTSPFLFSRAQPSNSASSNSYNINYNKNNKKGAVHHIRAQTTKEWTASSTPTPTSRVELPTLDVDSSDCQSWWHVDVGCVYVFIFGCLVGLFTRGNEMRPAGYRDRIKSVSIQVLFKWGFLSLLLLALNVCSCAQSFVWNISFRCQWSAPRDPEMSLFMRFLLWLWYTTVSFRAGVILPAV